MEPQELSPALLQPQVTAVAVLDELLATMASLDKDLVLLPVSPWGLHWDLERFTKDFWASLECISGTWWQRRGTCEDDDGCHDDPPTSLSQALAAYAGTPWTKWDDVTMVAIEWHASVAVLEDTWAWLARRATKLRDACREVATAAADMVATTSAWARELQDKVAGCGTARDILVATARQLGLALDREEVAEMVAGHKAQLRGDSRVATSQATRATMVRQKVEVALGLLERLVAACDEATASPRELRHRVGDIKATLEGTKEATPDVPEDLVAKVTVAERLWEANARLAKDHLVGTLVYIIDFFFDGNPDSASGCGVAERCQRAIEAIPRLVGPPERPRSVPGASTERPRSVHGVSPASVEPEKMQEVMFDILATLDKVVAILTGPGQQGAQQRVYPKFLCSDMRSVIWHLRKTLERGSVTSLGQALATLEANPGATWASVRAVAKAWRESAATLRRSWERLAEEAAKIRDACEDTATALGWDVQDEGACIMIACSNGMATGHQQLLLTLDRAEVVSVSTSVEEANNAMVEAVVATSQARAATRSEQVEVVLGLLERLVEMCDKGTMFTWDMQCRLRAMEATLEEIKKVSPDVPKALAARAVEAKRMWEASTKLFTCQLQGVLGDINDFLFSPYSGCGGPGGQAIAESH
ncbi:uncharacterized protein LOC128801721 [Vidua chalybeata]|uniref:uncharacterized protein LOC128801721 n=1 Tax=Vidua chalybeata TaxID=81927 RepID=UPI0023A7E3D4|nr:uncharacterized protein LOC128801721 [Vidua chalybeata]